MKCTLEIIPGKSIGPFRLGMTEQEIDVARRSLSPDALTLEDLGVSASFPKEDSPDGKKRCNRLEIRVFNNSHTILLLGKPVNNINNAETFTLFSSISPNVYRSYASITVDEAGIDAVRWEHSDEMIYCFFVMPPNASPKAASPPVFGSGAN